MMKLLMKICFWNIFIFLGMLQNAFADKHSPATLYQVSTVNALIEGLYQGDVSFKTLSQNGDFGLGSVKGMNGELIAIDGKFYRIAPDGKMNIIPNNETTPYAMVSFFHPTIEFPISDVASFKQLIDILNKHLPSRNVPYAVRIQGKFTDLKLRAVRGANPPYPPFSELVQKQAIFNLHNVEGDAVGIFIPVYLSKLNVPGYHIHFITKNRKIGGHILQSNLKQAKVELMPIDQLTIKFPNTDAFKESTKLNDDNLPLMLNSFGDGVQKN